MTPPCMVKCYGIPIHNGRHRRVKHGAPARLIRIEGDIAVVVPPGHKQEERYRLSDVREWRSRNGHRA